MTTRTYRHIRTRLATGLLRSGAQLSEAHIAQEVGVGRTPVREAFLLLENEGFIEQVPRYGTFVKKAGRHERQSLYELREVLEAYAAGKAAEYMSQGAIERLGALCDEIRDCVRAVRANGGRPNEQIVSRIAIADMTFHIVVLRASGNAMAIKMVADMHLMSQVWGGDRGDPYQLPYRDWVISWREHARIFRAIRRRNGVAASGAMLAHLKHATALALRNYDIQCRAQGGDSVGYEWPREVQEAISRYEELDPDALGNQLLGNVPKTL